MWAIESPGITGRLRPYGFEVGASGHALLQEVGDTQLLAVDMRCSEPDGSTYVVLVGAGQHKYVAGTIIMLFGSGQLKLQYLPNSRTQLMPRVSDIKNVQIVDFKDDEPLLEAWLLEPRYVKPFDRK
jgi:hypothetical protein